MVAPAPRLADGHVDFSGQWFPNGAGQGVSGRFGAQAPIQEIPPESFRLAQRQGAQQGFCCPFISKRKLCHRL